MNWLTRVRNAIPFIAKRDTPDNLWIKCTGCLQMIFAKEYEDNLSVCPVCNHHGRIGPTDRFHQLFDGYFCWALFLFGEHIAGHQSNESCARGGGGGHTQGGAAGPRSVGKQRSQVKHRWLL